MRMTLKDHMYVFVAAGAGARCDMVTLFNISKQTFTRLLIDKIQTNFTQGCEQMLLVKQLQQQQQVKNELYATFVSSIL